MIVNAPPLDRAATLPAMSTTARRAVLLLLTCAACATQPPQTGEAAPSPEQAPRPPQPASDGGSLADGAVESGTPEDGPAPPGVGLLHTAAQLGFMRANAAQEPWKSATRALLTEADAALARTPVPTPVFDVPFYYANPTASQAAKEGLRQDAFAAYALALAYQLEGSRAKRVAYASKSAAILLAWANVNKSVSGADGDLVVLYTGMPLLYAADLIANDAAFGPQRATFSAWVAAVFEKSASTIEERPNNWGDWGTLGVVASAGLANDKPRIGAEVDRIEARMASEIDANGELPEENKRTNSGMWYTFFALVAMTTAAQIAKNTIGVDLFSYVAPNGRSLRFALAREFHYAEHPDEWPYHLPSGVAGELWRQLYPCDDEVQIPTAAGWPGNLFELVSDVYGVPEWKRWVEPSRPLRGYHALIYPTLMRAAP